MLLEFQEVSVIRVSGFECIRPAINRIYLEKLFETVLHCF